MVPPASTNALSWLEASCSSVSRPHVMVPSASRETNSPVAPSRRCSMAATLSGGGLRSRHETAAQLMKLGLNMGYWGLVSAEDNLGMVGEAERLGYAVVW